MESHNHAWEVASVGKIYPLVKKVKMLKKTKAKHKRIIFTAIEPTLLLADSNARAVAVQQKAVNSAANSPIWFVNINY